MPPFPIQILDGLALGLNPSRLSEWSVNIPVWRLIELSLRQNQLLVVNTIWMRIILQSIQFSV
jgi:hypothetical protein